jgi:hypothetical protein
MNVEREMANPNRGSNFLVKVEDSMTLQDMAESMAHSGMFCQVRSENEFRAFVARAKVQMVAGADFGMSPVESMLNFYTVRGKPELTGHAIAAQIKRSGRYDYRIPKGAWTNGSCTIEFFKVLPGGGMELIGDYTFTLEDARIAGLTNSPMYKKYPRQMCFNRALSAGYKAHCPDVFTTAVYTTGELDTTRDCDSGGHFAEGVEIFDVVPEPVAKATEAQPTKAERKAQQEELLRIQKAAEARLAEKKQKEEEARLQLVKLQADRQRRLELEIAERQAKAKREKRVAAANEEIKLAEQEAEKARAKPSPRRPNWISA